MTLTREQRVDACAERVQRHVAYCTTCQPYDQGPVWIFGDETELDDLLAHHRVPEALRDDVAARLGCLNCGRTRLERWEPIGTKTDEEQEHERIWREWHTRYSPQLAEFGAFLSKYPYLGLRHPLGRQIQRSIAAFPRTSVCGSWWRAREPDGSTPFAASDMLPPPPAKAKSEGRFNHFGQIVFYLASKAQAAVREILPEAATGGVTWVQHFELRATDNVLDLRRPSAPYEQLALPVLALGLTEELPQLAPDPGSPWKPEYFVPRFIADCAREAGLAGVLFHSRRHLGENLVLFSWSEAQLTPNGSPRVVELDPRYGTWVGGAPNDVDF